MGNCCQSSTHITDNLNKGSVSPQDPRNQDQLQTHEGKYTQQEFQHQQDEFGNEQQYQEDVQMGNYQEDNNPDNSNYLSFNHDQNGANEDDQGGFFQGDEGEDSNQMMEQYSYGPNLNDCISDDQSQPKNALKLNLNKLHQEQGTLERISDHEELLMRRRKSSSEKNTNSSAEGPGQYYSSQHLSQNSNNSHLQQFSNHYNNHSANNHQVYPEDNDDYDMQGNDRYSQAKKGVNHMKIDLHQIQESHENEEYNPYSLPRKQK